MNARTMPVGPTCTPCVICARASRGFAFRAPDFGDRGAKDFCSNECVEIYMTARSKGIDLTPAEDQAVTTAAMGAGNFASNTIGKTDLGAMSRAEYLLYAAEFVRLYTNALRDLAAKQVPF
jgi:hypothetical protein